MNEKRQFTRYNCNLKSRFISATAPDEEHMNGGQVEGAGRIIDISQGGVFVLTSTRVSVNSSLLITFRTRTEVIKRKALVVRTGLLSNNPVGNVKRMEKFRNGEDGYCALCFDTPLENLELIELELI